MEVGKREIEKIMVLMFFVEKSYKKVGLVRVKINVNVPFPHICG